jgi:hypothetical protein
MKPPLPLIDGVSVFVLFGYPDETEDHLTPAEFDRRLQSLFESLEQTP